MKPWFHFLSSDELTELKRDSNKIEKLDSTWTRKLHEYIDDFTEEAIKRALTGFDPNLDSFDISPLVVAHSFAILYEGFAQAEAKLPRVPAKLAKRPPSAVPRNLRELMALWDIWRKKKVIPKRQQEMADRIKKAYLDKVQKIFRQRAKDFQKGKEFAHDAADQVKKKAGTTYARAKMIVETETTYYYNNARREVYDSSEDITHYLFAAIRDKATTKWCRTRQGLVFKKGSPLLDHNCPPVHWNCRSEILPLTPFNPKHKKLIDDKSRWAENNRMEPLPKGWTGRK